MHEEARGGVCDAAPCRRAYVLLGIAERRRKEAEAAERAARVWRARVIRALDLQDGESLVLALLPANDRPITMSPEERRHRFLDHLRAIVRAALEESAGASAAEMPPASDQPAARVQPLSELACATCKGHCCAWGGEHAYVDVPSVRRYLTAKPQWSADDLVTALAAKLPEQTYENSCVYHTEGGCALPRWMRSDTCNDFACEALQRLLGRVADDAAPRVLAAGMQQTRIVHGAIFDAQGMQAWIPEEAGTLGPPAATEAG